MSKDKISEYKRTILLLQDELKRLNSPPYMSGTVLDIGEKTVRISVDNQGIYELLSSAQIKNKFKKGSRVIINPLSKAILDFSEFDVLGGEISTVEGIIDGKLKIRYKGEPRLILSALEEVKVGEEIMLDNTGLIAIKRFPRKQTKYALEEIPEAPWKNIGGLEGVISKIKQEVETPFIHREIFAKYGKKPAKGILLYGPPGCGKTMIAKSIAYNLSKLADSTGKNKGHFIRINGPEILDKWVGNSEAKIRRVYESARDIANNSKYPVIVFVDEAESILKTRGKGISTDIYDSIVPQFLAEMDGLGDNTNIITILATNREDIIDPAVLRDGRIDRRIKIPRPNKKGAKEIFQIYLKDKPLQKKIFFEKNIKRVAEELSKKIYDNERIVYSVVSPKQGILGRFSYRHIISGAIIKGMVDRACNYAIQRELNKGKKGISQRDLELAIETEFLENAGFSQALVRDDWENVFGDHGRQYQEAYKQGYLTLENTLRKYYLGQKI